MSDIIKQIKKESIKNKKLNKNFEVKGICRFDIIDYIGESKTLNLSDRDMKNIADLMGDYLQDDYWNCLVDALAKLNLGRKT